MRYKLIITTILLSCSLPIHAEDKNSFFSDDFVNKQMLAPEVKEQSESDQSVTTTNLEPSGKTAATSSVSLSINTDDAATAKKLLAEFLELSEDLDLKLKALIIPKPSGLNNAQLSGINSYVGDLKERGVFVNYVDQQINSYTIKMPNRLIVEVAKGSYYVDVNDNLKKLFNSEGEFKIPKSAKLVPRSPQGYNSVNQGQSRGTATKNLGFGF